MEILEVIAHCFWHALQLTSRASKLQVCQLLGSRLTLPLALAFAAFAALLATLFLERCTSFLEVAQLSSSSFATAFTAALLLVL
jgi:hypothetical protein